MTAVWSWADLGDHSLQKYNIRQYWLLMSVLSVNKFNPTWKRLFIVDQITYDFIKSRNWDTLWDEIKIIDFKNTEYGNLYNINIYSWPKIYSYGLIDDDVIVIDIDIVFIDTCKIIDHNKIGGKFYDHINDFNINYVGPMANLSYKEDILTHIQNHIKHVEGFNILNMNDICLVGSPIYCPKHLRKKVQNILRYIIDVEKIFGGLVPDDCHCELEEEWPIAKIGHDNGGLWQIDDTTYRHGYTSQAYETIYEGFSKPESIIGENIFEKYIKIHECNTEFL